MTMTAITLAVALCGLGIAVAAGPGAPPTVFPARTDVVNVTVTVRDASGRFVSDLTADDFALYEDGRRQAVRIFAPAASPGQLVTIFFDQDIRISRYDGEHQQGLFQRILEAHPSGGTALYDAIAVYVSRVQNSSGRKVVVLLTDGEDTTSDLSLGQVIELVRSSPVTIYPIAFPGEYAPASRRALAARGFLYQLAALTGGEVFSPTASKDLPPIYERILDDLSAQYVLGFVSDDPKRDGRYRRLKVEVSRKGLRLRHRAGYYAPAVGG